MLLIGAALSVVAEPPQRASARVASAAAASTELDSTARREHFVVRDGKKNLFFELTELVAMNDTQLDTVLLVWDHGTGLGVRFEARSDYEKKQAVVTAEELHGGSFLRVEFPLPHSGKTIREAIVEGRDNPKLDEAYDGSLTFVTNSVRITTLESQWRDEATARAWRTQLRSSLSPSFLETLERLRELVLGTHPAFNSAATVARRLYHADSGEWGRTSKLVMETAAPDCRFDAEMGYECSEEQLRRIRVAMEAGKPLIAY